jgi:hypothetical protein
MPRRFPHIATVINGKLVVTKRQEDDGRNIVSETRVTFTQTEAREGLADYLRKEQCFNTNVENMTDWATEALEAALTHAATY